MERIRIVPFKINFEQVKTIDKYLNWFLYLILILGVIVLTLSQVFQVGEKESYSENLNYVIGIFSLFYFIGDLLKKFLLQLAEQRRRKDFIDNSLNTNLADSRSEGYYSNEEFEPGVYKMGINCFENSFFSMTISGKMIKSLLIKSLLIILLFTLLVMVTDKITVATFLQFALPYTIFQQTIVVIIYYFQVQSIFNYFKLLFSSAQQEKRNLLLIHNVINYESTISWAGIILDDKLFKNLNEMLSAKWEEIKVDHGIT
ncbi:hypothetical protein [Pedobacter jeongneungensis]|uniref:hypothetical protein n=1 Tax=Pedobacter jeongneungensis TaxID=947309 RepID=UPI00046A41C6|nr:hypothetical protein [Pedobacter jeongneungensis]